MTELEVPPRILLVDDELEVVSGLRRALTRCARSFEIVIACSAAEALVTLALAPCAVVVSDVQMPGITGLELLEEIARTRPSVGRVLLTGTAEANAATRALPTAHRFLCKPCNIRVIAETCRELHRYALAAEAAGPANDPALAMGSITALGIDVATIERSRAAVLAGRDAVLEIIEHPALAAALLHMTGSEFLGARTEVTTLTEAVDLVGTTYFERMIDSGFLLPVSGEAAAPIIDLAERARARAHAVRRANGSSIEALAALLLEVDRLGTSDMTTWYGLRESCGAAALLGMWGAPAPLVDQLAAQAKDPAP
ncbi:MAG TPA: response regulator [Kofleriaceae bacterium]|nr:response regulator [Kofleriaceae bacterium]